MPNIIKHKRNSVAGTVPGTGVLDQGELAINLVDGKLYTKNSSNSIINLGVTSISGTSITPSSGNFINSLQLNGTGVSLIGHTHTASDITNFNSSVSGLFPPTLVYTTGNQTLTGNLTIGGDLTVNGSTVITNVDTVTVEDPIITLGLSSGNIVPNLMHDRGLALVRGTGLTAFMGWDTSASQFVMLSSGVATNSSGNYDAGTYGNLQINNLNSNTISSSRINIEGITNSPLIYAGADGDIRFWVSSNGELGLGYNMVEVSSAPFSVNSSGTINNGTWNASTIAVNKGGTGKTSYSNGQLLIGSGTSLVANTLTAGTGISITNGSGSITINTSGLQTSLTNPVTGTGTASYVPKWSSTSGLSNSLIYDNGTNIGIGTTTPQSKFHISDTNDLNTTLEYTNTTAGFASGVRPLKLLLTGSNGVAVGAGVGIDFVTKSSSTEYTGARIVSNRTDTSNNHALTFWAGGGTTALSEYMRIASNGNIGIGTSSPTYKLQVNGNFGATTKSFRIDHPSKEGYSLEYGSLESPYHGVRLTGRGQVIKGVGTVCLPDYLKDLIHDDNTLNIQITNIKHGKTIYVDKIDLQNDQFIVKADRAKSLGELQFFWTLSGVRKDVDHLVVEKRN
jgi:hypothetical protein